MSYTNRVLNALSQLLNAALLNGDPNESISGRAHRERHIRIERVINALFWWEPEHCRLAHEDDVRWAQRFANSP